MREEGSEDRLETLERLLEIAVVLVSLWMMLPAESRKLWLLKTAQSLQRLFGHLAGRAGRAAMRRELQGARPGYELPETLSRIRDWSTRLYEKVRSL